MVEINRYARLAFTGWLGPGVGGMSGCRNTISLWFRTTGMGGGGVGKLESPICRCPCVEGIQHKKEVKAEKKGREK